ncbi:tyrosine-protein phosphatase [Geomonas propionica]|uniref:protein-tyrosine-phosphatase n=1 Tax=Geomonas propionica TaxID=2798582 RepID=A0ABS0YM58_9BACT|nr:CpsB/CapC family capsule biosynthesis tyrosine phosphatase [Geomonas propionica]MBJ6799064.1 phosphoesterase [Geomonas propionica]
MTSEFTDFHCHLLPALDDGAVNLRESLSMARTLSSFGFATVHCTPHLIRGGYENEPARVIRAVQLMQRRLDDEGIHLRLVPGNEHYLDQYLPEMLPTALRAGNSRYLLVEVPFHSGPELLRPMVQTLASHGLAPLIAHPERCSAFDPARARGGLWGALAMVLGNEPEPQIDEGSEIVELKRLGCRFQGNLGSFAGYYGYEVRERALLFLRHGLYSCFGSDAHRGEKLWEMLTAGYAVVESVLGEAGTRELLRGTLLANGA